MRTYSRLSSHYQLLPTALTLGLFVTIVTSFTSCRDVDENVHAAAQRIVCAVDSCDVYDFEHLGLGSRVVVTDEDPSPTKAKYQFHWSEGDNVGVFPETGTQVAFTMTGDNNFISIPFDGGGWSLREDMHYAGYYPLQPNVLLDPTNIPLQFDNLVQKGNGMADSDRPEVMHLLYTKPNKAGTNGTLNFVFHHAVSVFHFRILLPKEDTYTAVRLVTDGEFVTSAKLDCFAETNNITPLTTAQVLTLNLQDIHDTADDNCLDIFFPFYPVDLSGKKLRIEVVNQQDRVLGFERDGINFTAYKAGTFFDMAPFEVGRTYKADVSYQPDEERDVINPHKGWYHHLYSNNPNKYALDNTEKNYLRNKSFTGLDHLYVRLAWSFFNKAEGVYDWSYIDNTIKNYCIPYNLGISLRITCRETGSMGEKVDQCIPFTVDKDAVVTKCRYSSTHKCIWSKNFTDQEQNSTSRKTCYFATPYWVVKKIANTSPFGAVICDASNGSFSWIPDYGNPVFLQELEKFHMALAQHLKDKDYIKYVRYIDVGSLGDWGEGNTSSSTKEKIDDEVIKKHYDLYQRCYGELDVPIIIPENSMAYKRGDDPWIIGGSISSEIEPLMNYGKNLGMGLRYDSYLVSWQLGRYEPGKFHYSVLRPYMFDNFYQNNVIVHEQEHYATIKKDGHWMTPNGEGKIYIEATKSNASDYNQVYSGREIFLKAMELTHPTYIGYHGDMSDYLTDNPVFIKEASNKCGYWIRPVHASVNGKKLNVQWVNRGVAPCYYTYQLRLHYVVNGREYGTQIIDDSRNTTWMPAVITWQSYPELEAPATIYDEQYDLEYPVGIEDKNFDLYMELYDPDTQKSIDVCINNTHFKSGTKWIKIGSFTADNKQ